MCRCSWCCARPDIARRISLFRPFTEVYDSRGSAMDMLDGRVARWRHQGFPPVPKSAALARHLVTQACTGWRLAALSEPATMIVSELASNAIEHAATAFNVTVSYTTAYLRIAVQDGGPALPPWVPNGAPDLVTSDRGLGLYIVDATATAWNTTAITDGKIVSGRYCGFDRSAHRTTSTISRPNRRISTAPRRSWRSAGHTMTVRRPRQAARPCGRRLWGEDLTDREIEVLRYLPTMLTIGEIAAEMLVSVNTVKADTRSIYRKLDVSRRQDAVLSTDERGLLP